MIKVIAISDTHTKHNKLNIPEGDILIHAGDFSSKGHIDDLIKFNTWLGTLPHQHKIIIAGNHDFCFQNQPEVSKELLTNGKYLQDQLIELLGLKIYGSPWQPWFFDWAFNLKRGQEIKAKWDLIPKNTDILITHGPPMGILDKTARGKLVGCEELLKTVMEINPKYHIFGHIHEDYGILKMDKTTFINASNCNLAYQAINKPIVIDII